MSIHKSLISKAKLKRRRNVLTRSERIEKMTDDGAWNEGDTVFGLPAMKVAKARVVKRKKKEEEVGEVAEEGAAAPVEEQK